MKTRYTILSVAAAALVLTACSNEDELSLQQGDEVVRIASASVVNSAQTRVNSDGAGDIEELYHKDLPGGHRYEIDAVILRHRRGWARGVWCEDPFDDEAVNHIAQNQGACTDEKRNHGEISIERFRV